MPRPSASTHGEEDEGIIYTNGSVGDRDRTADSESRFFRSSGGRDRVYFISSRFSTLNRDRDREIEYRKIEDGNIEYRKIEISNERRSKDRKIKDHDSSTNTQSAPCLLSDTSRGGWSGAGNGSGNGDGTG